MCTVVNINKAAVVTVVELKCSMTFKIKKVIQNGFAYKHISVKAKNSTSTKTAVKL